MGFYAKISQSVRLFAATLHDLFSIIWFIFARNWMATWRNKSI